VCHLFEAVLAQDEYCTSIGSRQDVFVQGLPSKSFSGNRSKNSEQDIVVESCYIFICIKLCALDIPAILTLYENIFFFFFL